MTEDIQLRLDPRSAASELTVIGEVSSRLGIDANRIKAVKTIRRSIDARQRRVMINLTVRAFIDEIPASTLPAPVEFKELSPESPEALIVGAGPAGLFAALRLIELGIKPIIFERGKDVDTRRIDVADISRKGIVDPDSNYCSAKEAREHSATVNCLHAAKSAVLSMLFSICSISMAQTQTSSSRRIRISAQTACLR